MAEIPAWVTQTHPEHTYHLAMFQSNDDNVESIDMTRDEYIALKAHLAAMRGYTVGDFGARIADLNTNGPEGYSGDDIEQTATLLEAARDFYRCCPELVVFDSDELDEYIQKLANGK